MSTDYKPDLLETELKGHIVSSIEVWASGNRITIKTTQGACITYAALIKHTPNGIFPELIRETRR